MRATGARGVARWAGGVFRGGVSKPFLRKGKPALPFCFETEQPPKTGAVAIGHTSLPVPDVPDVSAFQYAWSVPGGGRGRGPQSGFSGQGYGLRRRGSSLCRDQVRVTSCVLLQQADVHW